MKDGIRSWLELTPAPIHNLSIMESFDFETNAAKNRIWYLGDANELAQLYGQVQLSTDRYKFWACASSPGMEIRKIHTGMPGNIVDVLTSVVLTDLNDIQFDNKTDQEIWDKIVEENELSKLFEEALKKTLYIGDGAFKISFDSTMSDYPIIEFYPGDEIELTRNRGRIREVIFRTTYTHNKQKYVLKEAYGYGYIKNRLEKDGKEVALGYLPETENVRDYEFAGYTEKDGDKPKDTSKTYILAVPMMIYKSARYAGRGQSIFDRKVDSFDSLDEAWSQWMDALRAGRTKEYIPDNLLPRDPKTGEILKPNFFDHRYIQTDSNLQEGAQSRIATEQAEIPHESYEATYVNALDLCLQGVISPSTMGIDVKKLDNADAQREKEKATLYTRNAIVDALTKDIKALAVAALKAYREFNGIEYEKDPEPTVTFGEYANPSFESQVETISKAKNARIMSTKTCVDELYGDTKDDDWKKEEVARILEEEGVAQVEEPAVNLEGVNLDEV